MVTVFSLSVSAYVGTPPKRRSVASIQATTLGVFYPSVTPRETAISGARRSAGQRLKAAEVGQIPPPPDLHGHPFGEMIPRQGGVHELHQTSQNHDIPGFLGRPRTMVVSPQD